MVSSWNVNGDDVELERLNAEPGCFVLVVKYRIAYERLDDDAVAVGYPSPVGIGLLFAQLAAQVRRSAYESDQVAFTLPVRSNHTYWVTATFNGDEFLPRIVESDAAGERIRQIDPSVRLQEINDCKANKLKPPP